MNILNILKQKYSNIYTTFLYYKNQKNILIVDTNINISKIRNKFSNVETVDKKFILDEKIKEFDSKKNKIYVYTTSYKLILSSLHYNIIFITADNDKHYYISTNVIRSLINEFQYDDFLFLLKIYCDVLTLQIYDKIIILYRKLKKKKKDFKKCIKFILLELVDFEHSSNIYTLHDSEAVNINNYMSDLYYSQLNPLNRISKPDFSINTIINNIPNIPYYCSPFKTIIPTKEVTESIIKKMLNNVIYIEYPYYKDSVFISKIISEYKTYMYNHKPINNDYKTRSLFYEVKEKHKDLKVKYIILYKKGYEDLYIPVNLANVANMKMVTKRNLQKNDKLEMIYIDQGNCGSVDDNQLDSSDDDSGIEDFEDEDYDDEDSFTPEVYKNNCVIDILPHNSESDITHDGDGSTHNSDGLSDTDVLCSDDDDDYDVTDPKNNTTNNIHEQKEQFSIFILKFMLKGGISEVDGTNLLKNIYTYTNADIHHNVKSLKQYVKDVIDYHPPISNYCSIKETLKLVLKKDIVKDETVYTTPNYKRINNMDNNKSYLHIPIQVSFDGVETNPFSFEKRSVDVISFKIMDIINDVNLIFIISIINNDLEEVVQKLKDELQCLYDDGFVYNNIKYNVYLLSIVADMPATIKLLNIHNFISSNFFCRSCNCCSRKIRDIKVRHSMRGQRRTYFKYNNKKYKYTETIKWKHFNKKSYKRFLLKYNKIQKIKYTNKIITPLSPLYSLSYFQLDNITFDSMHCVHNGLYPYFDKYINKIYSKYCEEDFRFTYSSSSSIYKKINMKNLKIYNLIQQNYIILNILPVLLLNDSFFKPLLDLINIVNMCIDYRYSIEKINNNLYNTLLESLIRLESESEINFTPSMHCLVHILEYTKYLNGLSNHSTSIFERSYKLIKNIKYSNNHINSSILHTVSLINQMNIYSYTTNTNPNKRKSKLIVNNYSDIHNIFLNTNIHNYSLVFYLENSIIKFGIIRIIKREETEEKEIKEITIQLIETEKISIKIYKHKKISDDYKVLNLDNIYIYISIFKKIDKYYFLITDFVEPIYVNFK